MWRAIVLAAASWLGLTVTCGCRDVGSPAPATPSDGIASLSPAMTTILQDLGAGPRLVGRTPWCRGVDDLPVVGALDGVDAEMLVSVQPAVVVHQPPSAGPDPVLVSLQERLGFTLVGGRLDGSHDVIAAIDGLAAAGVGNAALAARYRAAMEAMRRSAASAAPDGAAAVLILFSVDPFSAAGRETYLDEIVRAAGACNVTSRSGWMELSVEEIAGLAPDVVLLVSGRHTATDTLAGIPWRSAPRIVRLDAPEALEPSTRMPTIVSRVRTLLAEPDE